MAVLHVRAAADPATAATPPARTDSRAPRAGALGGGRGLRGARATCAPHRPRAPAAQRRPRKCRCARARGGAWIFYLPFVRLPSWGASRGSMTQLVVAGAKTQSNPERAVGVLTMAGAGC